MTSTANEHDHREAIREIAHCIVTLEKQHYGKGPERTVVRILPDMVLAAPATSPETPPASSLSSRRAAMRPCSRIAAS